MNLSTLSGPELRQLLDAARARGQAQLTYQILQEMEARRTERSRARGLFRPRRSNGEPRQLVLGDADDDPDIPPMPLWVAPPREPAAEREPEVEREPAAPPEPRPAHAPLVLAPKPRPKPARTPTVPPSRRRKVETAPSPDVAPPAEPDPPLATASAPPEAPPRPRSVWDDPPDEPLSPPPPVARPPKPRRFSRGSAVVFAVGMAAGMVLGVGASEVWRDAPPAAAPAPAPVQTAALAPPPAPVVATPAAPEPAPAPEPAATDAAVVAEAPAPETPPPENAGPAMELPREPEPSPDAADLAEAPAQDAGCAARATPADRTICGDPELQRLQRELRRAYARALGAHEEKDVLRQRQLAWRDARSAVSNPDRLAQLYEERIRRLNAATEAARRAR